ncbi:MAG: MBL fold metallo-hydrolase [Halioglobus sp.]
MATLTFYGGAQEVTGSCYLLESPALGRVLLDCGMHQGRDAVERIAQERFQFSPQSIDAVVLSHAHLDHSGLLPKLVHDGFDGPIHCTRATADLLDIMLHDSVGLYQKDLERDNIRRARRGKTPLIAEYEVADVEKALALCQGAMYQKPIPLGSSAQVCFHDAGHILGSSIVEIKLTEKGAEKTLVFSGDLGKTDSVLMNDPATLTKADVVLMEGTYGDRNHRNLDATLEQLEELLTEAWDAGGNVMIPSFAVGRTQEILFHLGCLHYQGKLDHWQVFLDSPMAIAVTKVYDRWLKLLDDQDIRTLSDNHRQSLEHFLPSLNLTVGTEESMAINRIARGAIIIAGSGMCTGGRIRHHFKQRIWQRNNTIVFIGYQAQGTLGRILVNGAKNIKLFGSQYAVKAKIETLGGFSAHAGQSELVEWISNFEHEPRVFLIHGDPKALDRLSQTLWEENNIRTTVPSPEQSIVF